MAQMQAEPVRPSTLWPDIRPELETLILRCLKAQRGRASGQRCRTGRRARAAEGLTMRMSAATIRNGLAGLLLLTAAWTGAAQAQDSILDASADDAVQAPQRWSWFGDLLLRYDHVEGLAQRPHGQPLARPWPARRRIRRDARTELRRRDRADPGQRRQRGQPHQQRQRAQRSRQPRPVLAALAAGREHARADRQGGVSAGAFAADLGCGPASGRRQPRPVLCPGRLQSPAADRRRFRRSAPLRRRHAHRRGANWPGAGAKALRPTPPCC